MSIKLNNANIKSVITSASRIREADAKHESGTRGVWFDLLQGCALARAEEESSGLKTIDDFKSLMEKCDLQATGSRASERWSIAKLGEYACVKPLFTTLRKLNPSPTALYDVSNYVRSKGPWGKDGNLSGKGADWETKNKAAPSEKDLASAIKAGNAERNREKVVELATPKEEIERMLKRLKLLNNDGLAKSKTRKRSQAALNNEHLTAAIRGLEAYVGGDKVAKRRIAAKKAARKAA